jgi:hypothetical protein
VLKSWADEQRIREIFGRLEPIKKTDIESGDIVLATDEKKIGGTTIGRIGKVHFRQHGNGKFIYLDEAIKQPMLYATKISQEEYDFLTSTLSQ